MNMDKETLRKEIKKVITTGKVYYGLKQAKKAIKKGEAKMLIVAENCPEKFEKEKIPKIVFEGDGIELGAVCGKPFNISVISVINPGESVLEKMVKK